MECRFWYSAYAGAVEIMIERLQSVAHGQGSSDLMVVFRNYLSEETHCEYLRDAMYGQLAEAFGSLPIDILLALKREDSHGTVPLGWNIVV